MGLIDSDPIIHVFMLYWPCVSETFQEHPSVYHAGSLTKFEYLDFLIIKLSRVVPADEVIDIESARVVPK